MGRIGLVLGWRVMMMLPPKIIDDVDVGVGVGVGEEDGYGYG